MPNTISKTHPNYWRPRVFKIRRAKGEDPNFSVKIQFMGQRETLGLRTPNREIAARAAAEIYRALDRDGWDLVLAEYKPSQVTRSRLKIPSVGRVLEVHREARELRPSTLKAYENAFRLIVSRIAKIPHPEGNDWESWRKRVDAVKLSKVTPARVQAWKVSTIRQAGEDPLAIRRARKTVSATIRNARAIFGREVLHFLRERLELPDPLPFEGIKLEPKQSNRYRSRIDVGGIVRKATEELGDDELKIFLLGLFLGLRKREIDSLQWSAFDFASATLSIDHTPDAALKTEESAADLDLEPALLAKFQLWSQKARGPYVICPEWRKATRLGYRCEGVFKRFYRWLRAQPGLDVQKPLHTLRKEAGTLICARGGIYAAKHFLRHSAIAVTAEFYTDQKTAVHVGLGGLLEDGKIERMG